MAATRNYREMMLARMREGKMVCVGLDSDMAKLVELGWDRQFAFNSDIIDQTAQFAQCYKIQISMYEALKEPNGLHALWNTVTYIKNLAEREKGGLEIPVILDFKRGDIGNSNLGYLELAYERLGVDAITINPYMGRVDGLQSFLDVPNKGVFVLIRTSNAGGAETQDVPTTPFLDEESGILYASARHAELEGADITKLVHAPQMPYYQFMAHRVAKVWNGFASDVGAVAGATNPDDIRSIREIMGDDGFILSPGLGKQEGDALNTVRYGLNSKGIGLSVNNSRGIIFADDPAATCVEFDQTLRGHANAALAERGAIPYSPV